jgi:hypothetical protein
MLSFGWLFRLFKRNNSSCKYVSKTCCTPAPTATKAKTYDIKPQNVYSCGCSTVNTCCCGGGNNGYRQSPYTKNYKKPGSNNHGYHPINTTFCNTCCCAAPAPAPIPPTPTSSYNSPTPTPASTTCSCINFYETQQQVSCGVTPTPAPAVTCVTQTVEAAVEEAPQPAADYVLPKEGHIFIMNGYGVNLDIDGTSVVGFIDMGVDVNVKPGQKVLIHHHSGQYEGKIGVIVSETNTERNPSMDQILIQKILDV